MGPTQIRVLFAPPGPSSGARSFICPRSIDRRLRDAAAFDGAEFLGIARSARRDPYRLSLFAEHLAEDEQPLIVLPIRGGTLVATDRRLLELRAHLEVHGAWNVKQFQGYTIHREIERTAVQEIVHEVQPASEGPGGRQVDDQVIVVTDRGRDVFLVSRGPEPTLSEADFDALRGAVLGRHPK
jgi:hypothetical protein